MRYVRQAHADSLLPGKPHHPFHCAWGKAAILRSPNNQSYPGRLSAIDHPVFDQAIINIFQRITVSE